MSDRNAKPPAVGKGLVPRFSEDYVIETLRGARKPTSSSMLRAFAGRSAWLIRKIESYPERAHDPKASFLVDELAAIAIAVELIGKQRDDNKARGHGAVP